MDFETAIAIAPHLEQSYPELVVSGVRRMSYSRPFDSWAVDIFNPQTGRMATLDEKDDWEGRLRGLFPELGGKATAADQGATTTAPASASRPSGPRRVPATRSASRA
jgi:hypothetical protein